MVLEASVMDQKNVPLSAPGHRSWLPAEKIIQRFTPFIYIQVFQWADYAHYWINFVYSQQDFISRNRL